MTFEQVGALSLNVVPSLGHRTLIHPSSLYVPQSCLNALPLPILQRQPQSEDESTDLGKFTRLLA